MLFLPVGEITTPRVKLPPVSDGCAATLLRPLHAVGCILTDITRESSSLHRRTEWLAAWLGLWICDRATAVCRVFRGIIASVFYLEGINR
jgi:hypothetical protein